MPLSSLEVGRVDDGRPRDSVLAEAVAPDIDENAGVRGTVRARDLDTSRQLASLAAGNPDLLIGGREWSAWKPKIPRQKALQTYVAAHIKLRPAARAGGVQGDRLGTDEVVTRGDLAGDLERALAAVCVESVGTPGRGGRVVAKLVNLEPLPGTIGCGGIVDLAHVDHDGAEVVAADGLIRAGPVVHLGVHLDVELIAG
jgi:hypothetical protein